MFSFSQIKLYQSCPKKYEFTYLHDFEYEEKESLPLLQGTILHDALRWLYTKGAAKGNEAGEFPTQDDLLAYFTTQWEARLPHHNFFDLQEATVQSAFQQTSKHLIQYYHQFFLPSLSTNEMTIGLEQRLLTTLPSASLPKGENPIETFSVTIDRLAKRGDTFIIYDYKTNKNLTEKDKQLHREQMCLYAWAVQENYGNYFSHLELRLVYLALDATEFRTVDETELHSVLKKYSHLATEISIKKEQILLTDSPDIFPIQKGEGCKWCTFREICPAFAQSSVFSSSGLTQESIQQLMGSYLKDNDAIKTLELEKQAMKVTLEEFFASCEVQRIFGENYQITSTQRDNRTIKDEEAVRELLRKKGLLDTALTLDKIKIKKLKESGVVPADLVQDKESVILSVKR